MASSDGSVTISVVLGTDDVKKELQGLPNSFKKATSGISDLADELKTGLATAAKVGAAAIGAASAGIAALTKASVDGYAEYEQLTGGVETLFKASSDAVMTYANNAYKTAGLSANDYMTTVTSFSASLLQGLGGDTAKAAEIADLAITDMADNANKMGTDMEAIQNAYQGFAKQNYTMLDNLKLGYGGTQSEMIRLINDSGILNETISDLDNVTFDQMIEAIHVVQTNMGITGTTALEASTTIQGSIASMKSAWTNLLTGIADENQDLDALIGNFVDSVATAGENIIPRVEQILSGIGDLIVRLAPVIAENLPGLIEAILPNLISAVTGLVTSLASVIPELLPVLVDAALQVVDEIGNGLAEKIPGLSVMFENLETVVIAVTAAMVAYKAATAISGIIEALTKATQGQTIAQTLLNAVMNANPFVLIITLIAGLVAALITLWNTNDGFREAVTSAWEAIKEVFSTVVDAIVGFFTETIPDVFNTVVEFFTVTVPNAISSFVSSVGAFFTETIPGFFESFVQWFTELPERIAYWLGYAIGKLISWGQEAIEWVITEVPKIIENIVNFFAELPGKIWEWLVSAVTKIAEWVTSANAKAQEVRERVIETIVNFFKELPGKVWTWLTETISKIGSFITGMGTKIKTEVPKIITTFLNFFKELPGKVLEIGKNIVDGLWNGIKNAWSNLTSKVTGLFGNLVQGIKDGLGIASPSKVFAGIGGFMAEGLAQGIENGMDLAVDAAQDMSNAVQRVAMPNIGNISIPPIATGGIIPTSGEFHSVMNRGATASAEKVSVFSGGSNDYTALLEAILNALNAGQTIKVGETVFGRTAIKAINGITTSSGKFPLKF